MEIKCSNFCCENIINTNKSHFVYYPKGFESVLKYRFCSENCEKFQVVFDNPLQRRNILKWSDSWKKPLEKNFRKFYDFMPESFFHFFKEKEVKNDFGVQYNYE